MIEAYQHAGGIIDNVYFEASFYDKSRIKVYQQ